MDMGCCRVMTYVLKLVSNLENEHTIFSHVIKAYNVARLTYGPARGNVRANCEPPARVLKRQTSDLIHHPHRLTTS
jgi:hypothetical protein